MTVKFRTALLAATFLGSVSPAAADTLPDPRDARIDALESQVKALTAIVEALRDRELANEQRATAVSAAAPTLPAPASVSAAPPSNPVAAPASSSGGATILAGKPSLQSADGRFAATLHGVMQLDAAGYFQRAAAPIGRDFRRGATAAAIDTAHARDLSNGTSFRRARIGVDGKVFGDFDYNILFEFGGSGAEDAAHIQELWLQYRGLKPFRFRIGAFSPSIGLEDQGSTSGSLFMERPAIADVARTVAGGDLRQAVQVSASDKRWLASVALTTRTVGTINSTGSSNAQAFDQTFGGIARLVWLPVLTDDYLVHLGIHGSRVFSVSDAGGPDVTVNRYPIRLRERPELRVDGTRLVDTGDFNASHANTTGLEIAVQRHQFLLQGEYERIGIERRASSLSNPHFSGWYAEGGWMLTGEQRKYNSNSFAFDGPPIDHPFDPANGTFGALELVARYSVLDLNYHQGAPGTAPAADTVRGGKQSIISGGMNWYLNSVIRFMVDYSHVKIDRLSPNATTFATPVGAQIGQSYDALSVRSQLAF